jgi:ABC-type multidrug transport system ATPase subunit
VREEEMRIRLSEPTDIKVRVLDFKKVYPRIVG